MMLAGDDEDFEGVEEDQEDASEAWKGIEVQGERRLTLEGLKANTQVSQWVSACGAGP